MTVRPLHDCGRDVRLSAEPVSAGEVAGLRELRPQGLSRSPIGSASCGFTGTADCGAVWT